MGYIIFNGVSSRDFHIQVEHPPEYEYPERDYTITHVPGRNGDLVSDNGSYKNINRPYEIALGSESVDFPILANRISEWLHRPKGYARLEDSYEPEYYRIAMYKEGINVENILCHAGRATINFDCKPQRFYKHRERSVEIQNGMSLTNLFAFTALPLIRVYGTGGTLAVGDGISVAISEIDEYVILDSETENAYKLEQGVYTNCNPNVTAPNFPKLPSGNTVVSWGTGTTKVEITPRWWTL